MAGYEFAVVSEHTGSLFGNIFMRSAVIAIAADMMFFILFIGEGIKEGLFGHGLMKGRIKGCDLGDFRQHGGDGFNSADKSFAVQRQKINGVINFIHDIFINDDRFVKIFSAEPEAVSDGADFGKVLNGAVKQSVDDCF